jgi:hypothetical protein
VQAGVLGNTLGQLSNEGIPDTTWAKSGEGTITMFWKTISPPVTETKIKQKEKSCFKHVVKTICSQVQTIGTRRWGEMINDDSQSEVFVNWARLFPSSSLGQ